MKIYLINEPVVLFDASCFLFIHGANPNYKRTLKDHIESTLENLNSTNYVGFIDTGKNFRHTIAKTAPYKGNRDKTDLLEKFPFFHRVKEELINVYNITAVRGVEVDDVVGILNRRLNPNQFFNIFNEKGVLERQELSNYKSVIATIDKDENMLNAALYNLTKHTLVMSNNKNSYIKLNKNRNKLLGSGFKFLYAQILMGDSTDNIKGLEKCGPVGAFSILENCNTEEECTLVAKKAFYEKEKSLAEKALKIKKAEINSKELSSKIFCLSEEELWEKALKKYNEMYSLIFILRKNHTLRDIKIQKYKNLLLY